MLIEGPDRLVTVVGLAGVGKSRLVEALCFAEEGAQSVAWPVIRIGLAGEASPDEAILRALSCDPGGPPARLGHALSALGEALLVLDAAEDVADFLASRLGGWLAAAPGLRVLVTSRLALGVPGEVRLALEPLAEADALALLGARARRLRRDLELDGPDALALVRELDGIPHAIEWAAGQLAVLSAADLVAILREGEAGSVPWLHGLDRSVQGLDPALRAGLVRLAAHVHPLPPREAARVVGGLELLGDLRRMSLVGPAGAGDPRLRVYRTVLRVLEGPAYRGDRASAAADHAARVLARGKASSERLSGPGGPEALAETVALGPELRAVVERATARSGGPWEGSVGSEAAATAASYLGTLRVFGKGESASEEQIAILLAEPALPAASRAVLLFERAGIHSLAGRVGEVLDDLALVEAVTPLDPALAVQVALVRSSAQRRAGALDAASDSARQALAWAEAVGDRGVEVEALRLLSGAATEPEAQERFARAAVQVARASGDPLGLIASLLTLSGSVDELSEGLSVAERAGFARAAYYFRSSLASRMLEEGLPGASEHLDVALALARRNGWERLCREGRAIHDIVRWSVDPGVDCRATLRQALTDGRGGGDEDTLLAFLDAAEAEADPASPPAPLPARSPIAALCAAAADAHRALDAPPDRVVAVLARARELLVPASGRPPLGERTARRILARAAARLEAARAAQPLRVGEGGAWFSIGEGPKVSLDRRVPLRRLLWALAGAEAPLTVEDLFAAGWPGQSIRSGSAAQRVYVAVNELRKLGLGERLQTADGGYVLAR